MKKFIASTLLIASLTPQAQANILSDLLERFSSINKKAKTECEKMSNEEVALLCAEEVCGPADQYKIVVDSTNIEKFTSKETLDYVSTIEDIVSNTVEMQRDFLNNTNKRIEELQNITSLTDKEAENHLNTIADIVNSKHTRLHRLIPLSGDNKGKIRRILPKDSPFNQFYKDVVSNLSIEDNLELATKLSGEKIPDKTKAKIIRSKIEKIINNAPNLSEKDKETIKLYEKNPSYPMVVAMAEKYDVKISEPICNDACKEGIKKFYKDFSFPDLNKQYEVQFTDLDIKDRAAQCMATYTLHSAFVQDSKEAEVEWQALRQRFIDDTNLKLSAHSKGLVISKIDSDLTVAFHDPLGSPEKIKELFQGSPILDRPHDKFDIFKSVNNMDQMNKVLKAPECKGSSAVSITDHVLPSVKNGVAEARLHVSPFSCEHIHSSGREIMAHELGHVISHFIEKTPEMSTESRNDFISLRQCSKSEKKSSWFFSLSPNTFDGDRLTTEEDTADLIAHMLSPDKDSFMSCPMLMPHEGKYHNVRFKKMMLDTHSSSMARLLVELQYKNPEKITEACAESIKRSKQKINNKCY